MLSQDRFYWLKIIPLLVVLVLVSVLIKEINPTNSIVLNQFDSKTKPSLLPLIKETREESLESSPSFRALLQKTALQSNDKNLFQKEFNNLKQRFILTASNFQNFGILERNNNQEQNALLFSKEYFHFFFQDWYLKYLREIEGYMKEDGFLTEETTTRLESLEDVVNFLYLFADYLAFNEEPDDKLVEKQILEFKASINQLPKLYQNEYVIFQNKVSFDSKKTINKFFSKLAGLFSLNATQATFAPKEIKAEDILSKIGSNPADLANVLGAASVENLAEILGFPADGLPETISAVKIIKKLPGITEIKDVADILGISVEGLPETITTAEIIKKVPGIENVADLADILGVSVEDLPGIVKTVDIIKKVPGITDITDIANILGISSKGLPEIINAAEIIKKIPGITDVVDIANILGISIGGLPEIINVTDIINNPVIMNIVELGELSDIVGIQSLDLASILDISSGDLAGLLGLSGLAQFLPLGELNEIIGQLSNIYNIVSSISDLAALLGTGGLSILTSIPGIMDLVNFPGLSDIPIISDVVSLIPIPGLGGFIGGFGGCKSYEPADCYHVKDPQKMETGGNPTAPCCSCYKKVGKKCKPIGCLNKVCEKGNAIYDYETKICGCDEKSIFEE